MSAQLPPTPGQTAGPFFGFALPFERGNELVPPSHPDALRLHGYVYDGRRDPIPDALVELWQSDPDGSVARQPGSLRRDGWTFSGWGRAQTDNTGHYWFSTLIPGAAAAQRPGFFAMTIFARGLLNRLFTRAYLDSDGALLDTDPLLSTLSPDRRATLVAARDGRDIRFDIHLQGDLETVFLQYPTSAAESGRHD